MNLNQYKNKYTFDKGLNLIQQGNSNTVNAKRMIVSPSSNRAISSNLLGALNLSPTQKINFQNTLTEKKVFDRHGNQLLAQPNPNAAAMIMGWDYRNMLQITVTDLKDEQGEYIGQLKEYNVYAKAGQRNRKVTKKTNADDQTTEITESMYLGNLEYRTTWQGTNLSYDGETVTEEGSTDAVAPYEAYSALRIRQGHKQVATKKKYSYKAGEKLDIEERSTNYTLSDNIDSCSMTLNKTGELESYEAYKPYGETAVNYGRTDLQPYKYSGQEKDQSGLYYYGFRSLLPTNFRWMSPDPIGMKGSGLNWYAMVGGNPVTMRDMMGLTNLRERLVFGQFRVWDITRIDSVPIGIFTMISNYFILEELTLKKFLREGDEIEVYEMLLYRKLVFLDDYHDFAITAAAQSRVLNTATSLDIQFTHYQESCNAPLDSTPVANAFDQDFYNESSLAWQDYYEIVIEHSENHSFWYIGQSYHSNTNEYVRYKPKAKEPQHSMYILGHLHIEIGTMNEASGAIRHIQNNLPFNSFNLIDVLQNDDECKRDYAVIHVEFDNQQGNDPNYKANKGFFDEISKTNKKTRNVFKIVFSKDYGYEHEKKHKNLQYNLQYPKNRNLVRVVSYGKTTTDNKEVDKPIAFSMYSGYNTNE